jgi:FkbM family methyltransferase
VEQSQDLAKTSLPERVAGFGAKPWRRKFQSFAFRWLRIFPRVPLPMKLPYGCWWMLRGDVIGQTLLEDRFESKELRFAERFLRPGMVVLDIGANQGFYTLLASKFVGTQGKVMAFEPSPRELRRLKFHLWLNRCHNVEVSDAALGSASGNEDLHVVLGSESGCNSLRPPEVSQPTRKLQVRVERLDDALKARQIAGVDFMKLDVEGAELAVLQGASALLSTRPRPIILAEVEDIRTQPWGYPAKEILLFLRNVGYRWFSLNEDASLSELDLNHEKFEGNFVAWPGEQEVVFPRAV